jgi:NAD(P)-dependent dehydrogenase (short-subunit alcohol dehydrogenase family)/acyl carrier protein
MAQMTPRLREGGTYVIIGGLGAMGLVFSECLARTVRGRLVLTGRTGLPAKDEWGQWLESHNEEDAVSRKIRRVKALEELGAEVLVVSLDVANEGQMQRMIALTEERFGGINGVIHAAGTIVEAPIEELTLGLFEEHFHSKVKGLFVLEKVLEGKALDFCLLTSSLSSVLGGIGYTGYTAANLFMDAFAHRHNQTHSMPWVTINWDAWQLHDENGPNLGKGTDLAELSIKPKEGWIALQHILSLDLDTQLVVSTGDLEARLDKWIKLQSLREQEQTEKADMSSLSPRPSLSSDYVIAGNPTEQTIAAIWQELLGVAKVGIHDNFFELGGHSLLATRIIARLRQVFSVKFSAATLFERPTVHSLSKMILEDQDGESFFVESQKRGQRRKERRLQRDDTRKRMKACEGPEPL